MSLTKSKIFGVLFSFVLLFSIIAISANLSEEAIAATDSVYFSAEQYTESDKLLLPDGTPSPNRSIKNFATDVKVSN